MLRAWVHMRPEGQSLSQDSSCSCSRIADSTECGEGSEVGISGRGSRGSPSLRLTCSACSRPGATSWSLPRSHSSSSRTPPSFGSHLRSTADFVPTANSRSELPDFDEQERIQRARGDEPKGRQSHQAKQHPRGKVKNAAVPPAAHLSELQSPMRAVKEDACRNGEIPKKSADLAGRRKEALPAPVKPGGSRTISVPEVDRERAVRKVEPDRSTRRSDTKELGNEPPPIRVARLQRAHLVAPGSQLLNADVLEHPGCQHDVEKPISDWKRSSLSDGKPVLPLALPPLPLPKRGRVVSPRRDAGLIE